MNNDEYLEWEFFILLRDAKLGKEYGARESNKRVFSTIIFLASKPPRLLLSPVLIFFLRRINNLRGD